MGMSRFLIFVRKFIFSKIVFIGVKPVGHNAHEYDVGGYMKRRKFKTSPGLQWPAVIL